MCRMKLAGIVILLCMALAAPLCAQEEGGPLGGDIEARLQHIVLKQLETRDASMHEMVDYLVLMSGKDKDAAMDPNMKAKGMNILLMSGFDPGIRGNLSMPHPTLGEALRAVAAVGHAKLRYDPYAIVLVPEAAAGAPRPGIADIKENDPALSTLEHCIVHEMELYDATLADSIDFLNKKMREIEEAAGRKEVVPVIVYWDPNAGDESRKPIKIENLALRNVPMSEVLRYIAEMCGLGISMQEGKITLYPKSH